MSFRLKRRMGGTALSQQSITLRSTDTQLVDLTAALAHAPASARITVSVSGSVKMQVWPYVPAHITSGSRSFSRARLLDHLAAVTSSASAGGTWHFRGPGVNHLVTFSISNAAPPSWDYGQLTLAQFGGYPIAQYLSGTASDWTIQSQSTAGAFTINAGTNCVAFAGTSGSTTRTVGTPTLGNGTYTVTLVNAVLGGATHTISFNILANRYDVHSKIEELYTTIHNRSFPGGTEIWLNDNLTGEYMNSGRAVWSATNGTRTGSLPAGPYVGDSWEPQASRSPNWITIRPRTPWGTRINRFAINSATNLAQYVRWYLLDNRSTLFTEGAIERAGNEPEWIMFDHCMSYRINFAGNTTINPKKIFVLDNYIGFDDASRIEEQTEGVFLVGYDSQVVGNYVRGIGNDAMAVTLWNSTWGSGRSKIWWNFVNNKGYPSSGAHGDFFQEQQPNSGGPNAWQTQAKADATGDTMRRIDFASFLGNILVRGQGVNDTKQDGQGIWMGDTFSLGEYTRRRLEVGTVYVGTFLGGGGIKWPAVGSVVRNCTWTWPQYMTGSPAGAAAPLLRVLGLGGKISIADCVSASTTHLSAETNLGYAPPDAVQDNNVGLNSTANAPANFSAASSLNGAEYIEDIIDALYPTDGGVLTHNGGVRRQRIAGAIGTGRLDHLLRTYEATVFDPLPGAPAAQATWTAATPTGTTTVGSTLTAPNFAWSESVTILAYHWLRNRGTEVGANQATYVIQAADVGNTITVEVVVTDVAGNKVRAVSNEVTPT